MFKILRHYGIPELITEAIKVLYTDTESSVLLDGQQSSEFSVKTGILQGDTPAPFLFIIVVDYIMTNSDYKHLGFIMQRRLSRRSPEVRLNDLEFADDIALLENSIPAAQSQLSGLALSAKNVNLSISGSKTKVFALNTGFNTPIKLHSILRT